MKRLKLDYFALNWTQIFLPLLSCGKGYKGFQAELSTPINSGMYALTKEMCGMWLTDFAKTELPIPDPSYQIFPTFFSELCNDRGYYMPARGYEFYLRVFKSISHSFALAALTREKSTWTLED